MAFALWWLSIILLVVAMVFYILGAKGIAGITVRIATWLMVLAIIGACILLVLSFL